MSATKKTLGNYNIKTIGAESNVHVTTHTFHVHGNLVVFGSSSSITSNNTQITDNFITLNVGWTLEPTLNAGIEVDRGFIANVAVPHAKIIWDETDDAWKLDNGLTVEYILTSTTGPNAGLEKVEDDPTPKLGGNLNAANLAIINANTITGNTITVTTVSNLVVETQNLQFKIPAETVELSTSTPQGGGTGLYVSNNEVTEEELITKSRAIVYSIIF